MKGHKHGGTYTGGTYTRRNIHTEEHIHGGELCIGRIDFIEPVDFSTLSIKAYLVYTPFRLYNNRPKFEASLLSQMRIGINCLNSYLFSIGAVESDQCAYRKGEETVHHFLFSCPMWVRHRVDTMRILRKENRWGDTSYLLGGWSGCKKDSDFSLWRPNLQAVTSAIKFAIATGRLTNSEDNTNGDKPNPEQPEVGEESEEDRLDDRMKGPYNAIQGRHIEQNLQRTFTLVSPSAIQIQPLMVDTAVA